jgi:hypothetical protein
MVGLLFVLVQSKHQTLCFGIEAKQPNVSKQTEKTEKNEKNRKTLNFL